MVYHWTHRMDCDRNQLLPVLMYCELPQRLDVCVSPRKMIIRCTDLYIREVWMAMPLAC